MKEQEFRVKIEKRTVFVPYFSLPIGAWNIEGSGKHAKIKHSKDLIRLVFLCLQLSCPTWCLASLAPKSPFWYVTECLFSEWQTTAASICIMQFLWQKHFSPDARYHQKQRCLCSSRSNITEAESEYLPVCSTNSLYMSPQYIWWHFGLWPQIRKDDFYVLYLLIFFLLLRVSINCADSICIDTTVCCLELYVL